jgi:outer membrane protein assembly factor BamA
MEVAMNGLNYIYLYPIAFLLFFPKPTAFAVNDTSEVALSIYCRDSMSMSYVKSGTFMAKDSIDIEYLLYQHLYDYYNNGYLAANIDTVIVGADSANAFISKNRQYTWAVLYKGNVDRYFLKKAGINLDKWTGKPLSINSVMVLYETLINAYENNGYPFASVKLTDMRFQDNGLKAALDIEPYKLFLFDSLVVKGAPKLSKNYIRHYLGLKKGETFNGEKYDGITRDLKKMKFVKVIKPHAVDWKRAAFDVYTYLESKKTSYFDGIIGIAPQSDDNNSLQLTGNVNLALNNQFNAGEKLLFEWDKLPSQTQSLETAFNYPFLFNSQFGAGFDFSLFKQDTSYINVNPKISLSYYFNRDNRVYVFVENENSSIIGNNEQEVSNIDSYSKTLYGMGVDYNNFDNVLNPTSGFNVYWEILYGNRITNEDENDIKGEQAESIFDGSWYHPLYNRWVGKLRNQTGYLNTGQNNNESSTNAPRSVYDNELFRIGGISSIRGFNEQSIYASFYTIISGELRFILEENAAFYTFLDYAYYEKHTIIEKISDTPFGFGVGAQFSTGAGIFSLSYALGKQFNNTIDLRSGKIHLGFVNRF